MQINGPFFGILASAGGTSSQLLSQSDAAVEQAIRNDSMHEICMFIIYFHYSNEVRGTEELICLSAGETECSFET